MRYFPHYPHVGQKLLVASFFTIVSFTPTVSRAVDPIKSASPITLSQFAELSGDPSVRSFDGRMNAVCTTVDLSRWVGAISLSASADGHSPWDIASVGDEESGEGLILRGREDTWEHQLETGHLIKVGNSYFLFYCGYTKEGWPYGPAPRIGVAVSDDGLHFTRPTNQPVLPLGNYDGNGQFSASVLHNGKEFVMVYCGHQYSGSTAGIRILGATSPDGISWTKTSAPVLGHQVSPEWMIHGVGEPDLVQTSTGYHLFFTGNLGDDESRCIGYAKSDSPFGPYTVRTTPIVSATPGTFDEKGVLAPSAIIEGNKLRLWYLTSDDWQHMTGYAELPWPITD